MAFSPIPELIEELKAGRMIVLTDDEDRENEGDLVALADTITPDQINFMLKEARGVLCLSMSAEICDRLDLKLQAPNSPHSKYGTAFTESIDAAEGVTTGVSKQDRWKTIKVAIDPKSTPLDITRPGHLNPLRARRGGVLVRPGQTEGSVDLARMAGATEAAVIIEIMNDDGSMSRLPDLETYIKKHDLKMGCIADLIEYRRSNEKLVERLTSTRMPTRHGEFTAHLYASPFDSQQHIALTRGIELPSEGPGHPIEAPVLGRVHSECLTGDAFGSRRCDCGDQLDVALARIAKEEQGFLLYMRQEGRGIGLEAKLKAYGLQDRGLDTVEANTHLGFKPDQRNYGTGAQILYDLGFRRLRLLTNNPVKRSALSGYGLEIVERESIEIEPNDDNRHYLETKKRKMGHLLENMD
jgi:3,4-dihydroxy 2-butanone 4-phosphate synthase / GTP cyclohydrolase II